MFKLKLKMVFFGTMTVAVFEQNKVVNANVATVVPSRIPHEMPVFIIFFFVLMRILFIAFINTVEHGFVRQTTVVIEIEVNIYQH